MDFSRIRSVMDVETLKSKKVTVFGAGASVGLILDLCRCGVQHWRLVDFDSVSFENISRQGHYPSDIGRFKVDAVKDMVLSILPCAEVDTVPLDCTSLTDDASIELFAETDLFVAATDSFICQAYVNRLALLLNHPAVFIGIYPGGMGAEIVWIDPIHLLPCMQCVCSNRYKAQEEARSKGQSADPSSDGADIFSVRLPDAIAGQIIVGLLTRGADNRYGRLINQLGDRQFLQICLSPEFRLNGRDIVREKLHVGPDVNAYFSWNSIAIPDPDQGQLRCPDCERYRNHRFEENDGTWKRILTNPCGHNHETESEVSIGGE